ncbi:NACHT domain-containing protein [Streptomyces sp. SID5926]|nr:NACHT domain-containing protein [Streptomyces sp. SID5926]
MSTESVPGLSVLSQDETKFFEALEHLWRAAGSLDEPVLRVRVRTGSGKPLKKVTLWQWLHRDAVPREGSDSFRALVDFLLARARQLGATGLKDYRHYDTLRHRATKARAGRMRAAKPSELLRAYLHAVDELAVQHPTPGLARWTRSTVPGLTEVYQFQRSTGSAAHDDEADEVGHLAPLHPSTVLRGDSCLVLAGPGGGKSSLLRAVLLEGLHGPAPDVPVPVMLPARALADAGPLAHAVARHVEKELGALTDKTPGVRELFAARPRPDAPWLLLVDGLDEVVDPALRRRVLDALKSTAAGDAPVHRFVVTSRPLPEEELDYLGEDVGRRELQPFDSRDLQAFATKWFTAQGMASPQAHAGKLLGLAARSGLATLARVPLMATILCHLYQADAEALLPDSRGGLYQRFTDLLQERQFQADLLERVGTTLSRYPRHVAEDAVTQSPQLVETLALGHLSGKADLESSLRLTGCPSPVPLSVWQPVLRDIVRSTGLLIERAGQLEFLHQTVAEYLAVRHLAHDLASLDKAVHAALKAGRRWPRLRAARRMLDNWRAWHLPEEQDSHTGFLLDRAVEKGIDCESHLRRMVALGGAGGSAFVVRQHLLGTRIASTTVEAAIEALAKAAARQRTMGTDRLLAIRLLIKCGDSRGQDALEEIAVDPASLRIDLYWEPREQRGDPPSSSNHEWAVNKVRYRALLKVLARIAQDPDMSGTTHVHAAIAMEKLDRSFVRDQSGLDVLRTVSRSEPDPQDRKMAKWALANATWKWEGLLDGNR